MIEGRNLRLTDNSVHYGDTFAELIERAVEAAVRKVLDKREASKRRLLSVKEAACYLALSKREIYNMISKREVQVVFHGRRKMLDLSDLDELIERKKDDKHE